MTAGEHGYYNNGDPVPADEWENRKIMGIVWEKYRGWRLETKECSDLTGPAANYIVNACMITMIKESSRNRSITFRSDM